MSTIFLINSILVAINAETVDYDNPYIVSDDVVSGQVAENKTDDTVKQVISDESISGESFYLDKTISDMEINETTILNENTECNNLILNKGTFDLNGYTINVRGNVVQKGGVMLINRGALLVDGSYFIENDGVAAPAYLKMLYADDYILVNENFRMFSSYSHNGLLKAGTIEVKGDFEQKSGNKYNFCATENHNVLLSGENKQIVEFEELKYSKIQTLELNNISDIGVIFKTPIYAPTNFKANETKTEGLLFSGGTVTLANDVVVNGDISFKSNVKLNGFNFTINGDLTLFSNELNLNGGTLTVNGDLNQLGGVVNVNNGELAILDDYNIGNEDTISTGYFLMRNSDDYVFVNGNFYTNTSATENDRLTNGVLEVKGDFNQISSTGGNKYNYYPTSLHKTILSGDEGQSVNLDNVGCGKFNILELKNTSSKGIDFINELRVSKFRINNTNVILPSVNSGEWTLEQDVTLYGNLRTVGNINLNGHKLKVIGNVSHMGGTIYINGGNLIISGDYYIGDNNNSSKAYLRMINENDYVMVNGSFLMNSDYNHSSYLTKGLLEIKGDFTQLASTSSANYNFCTGKEFVTRLSGNKVQNVNMQSKGVSRFYNLEITKELDLGYNFLYKPMWNVLENVASTTYTMPIPENLKMVKSNGKVKLTWTCNDSYSTVAGFNIYKNGVKCDFTANHWYYINDNVSLYSIKSCDISGLESDASISISANDVLEITDDYSDKAIIVTDVDTPYIYKEEPVTFNATVKNCSSDDYAYKDLMVGIKNKNSEIVWSEPIKYTLKAGTSTRVKICFDENEASNLFNNIGENEITIYSQYNNRIFTEFNKKVSVYAPNLTITNIKETSFHKGQNIGLTITVKNTGNAPIISGKGFKLNAIIDGNELVSSEYTGSLAAGASVNLTLNKMTDGNSVSIEDTGVYTVNAKVDIEEKHHESDETDNIFFKDITVGESNLNVISIKPDNIYTGTNIQLSAVVKNTGNATNIDTATVNFCVNNEIIGSGKVSNLEAGKTTTVYASHKCTIPIEDDCVIKAYIDGGEGFAEKTVNKDIEKPKTPSDFTIVNTNGKAELKWSAAKDNVGIKGYKIYRDGKFIANVSGLKFTENEIVGEAYYYVTAYDWSDNESDRSNELVFDSLSPAQVSDIVISASALGINLVWAEAEDNIGTVGYYIYRDGVKIADVSEPIYNDTEVISGYEYSYCIEAYDEWKNVSERSKNVVISAALDTDPPSVPTGLKVSNKTATSIIIDWEAADDNMSISGYEVFRNGESIGITGCTEYKDSELVSGNTYEYSVLAIDTAGNKSEKTAIVNAVPNGIHIQKSTPVAGTTFGGSSRQTFRVYSVNDNNSSGSTAVMSYSADGIDWIEVSMKGPYASGSSFYFEGSISAADIAASGKYFIRYTVYDADGNAATLESDFYVDKTPPEALENLCVQSEAGSVKITWNIAKEADVTSYRIYRSENENGTYKQISTIKDRNKNVYIDSDVYVNITYYYKLAAVDRFGQIGESCASVSCLVADDTESPVITSLMPVNDTVLSNKNTITVKAEDNIDVVSLRLQYNIPGSSEWVDIGTPKRDVSSASFKVDDIPVEGSVNIRAVAEDAMGNVSDNYYVRSYIVDRTGPEKVVGITTVSYINKLLVNWQDVEDNDFSYFKVEYKEKSETEYKKYINVSQKRGTYIDNLKADTEYSIRIAPYDIYGNRGTCSDVVTVKTTSDNNAPVIKKITPYPGRYSELVSLNVNAADETGVSKVTIQYRKNGDSEWTNVYTAEYDNPQQNASAACKWDTKGLTEGIYTIRAICEDMFGNVSDGENTIYVEYYIDHTPPAKPVGIQADGSGGYIKISWDKGNEEDLKCYNLYRSENGLEYRLIKDKLAATYYNDRDTVLGNDYSYYVTPVDTTGHEGSSSEAVSCKIEEDTTAPQILSVSPKSTRVLSANPNIGVSAKDNYMLSSVRLEYLNGENEWELIEEKSVDVYAVNVVFKWDASNFADGNYSFRAIAIDTKGNASEPYCINYDINTEKPDMSELKAEGKECCAELSWQASAASDLAAYYIYRSDNQGSSYKKIGTTGNTFYMDKNVLPGKTYYYKAEAVDKYDNRTESNICIVNLPDVDTIAPVANAGKDRTAVLNTAAGFDGTKSTDNAGIKEYLWDFGDGAASDLAQPSHIYTEAGEYTVTLTVKDAKGNSGSTRIKVTVIDLAQSGTAVITLKDSNTANPVANASVYVKCTDGSTVKAKTDSNGNYELTGMAGNYEVCFYKEDYLPTSLKTTLKAGDSLMLTQTIEYGKVVVGTLSVKRMTLDEIEAVGIDVTAPENQVVYRYEVKISYISEDGEESITTDLFANPDGDVYNPYIPLCGGGSGSGGYKGHGGNSSTPDLYADAVPNKQGKAPTLVYWVIPGSTSWLKEFFEIKLVVDNKADGEFTLEDSCVTLNLPEGLEFVPSDKSKSLTIDMGTIAGSTSKTVSWIIKGNAKGSYNLTADYSGILMPFEEEIKTTFKTKENFRVYGSDALHMYVEYPDYVKTGESYKCRVGIKNTADFTIYNLNLSLTNGETLSIKELKPEAVLWSEQTFVAEKTGNFASLEVVTVENEENAIEYTGIPVRVPLDVYVTDSCLAPEMRGDRAFAIHTTVYNQKDYDVKNVKATITFENPESIEMLDDFYTTELTKTIEELTAGETTKFEWEIRVKDGFDISNVKYTITVTADELLSSKETRLIDTEVYNEIYISEKIGAYVTNQSRKVFVNVRCYDAKNVYVVIKNSDGNIMEETNFVQSGNVYSYGIETILAHNKSYNVTVVINKGTGNERYSDSQFLVSEIDKEKRYTVLYETNKRPGLDIDENKMPIENSTANDLLYNDCTPEELRTLECCSVFTAYDVDEDDDVLFDIFEDRMLTYTFGEGESYIRAMVNHFKNGNGETFSHPALTEAVKNHINTQKYIDFMTNEIKKKLKETKGDISVINPQYWKKTDVSGMQLADSLNYETKSDYCGGLGLAIHDVWANDISIRDYQFDGKNYKGVIKLTIYDHFGLDRNDIDNDNKLVWFIQKNDFVLFRAWYLLQHNRKYEGKYKPFITKVEIEYNFEGRIE